MSTASCFMKYSSQKNWAAEKAPSFGGPSVSNPNGQVISISLQFWRLKSWSLFDDGCLAFRAYQSLSFLEHLTEFFLSVIFLSPELGEFIGSQIVDFIPQFLDHGNDRLVLAHLLESCRQLV